MGCTCSTDDQTVCYQNNLNLNLLKIPHLFFNLGNTTSGAAANYNTEQ